MPDRQTWRLLFSAVFAMSILSGCGGGDTSPASQSSSRTISGFVEDGPIAGARVQITARATDRPLSLCGADGRGLCETVSDGNGFFQLEVPPDLNIESLELRSAGGSDIDTWVDFESTGVILRAPLALFSTGLDSISINPLTSLVSARLLHEGDISLARQQVRDYLGLAADESLTQRPAQNPRLLRLGMTLIKIALLRGDLEDPLGALAPAAGAIPLVDSLGELDALALAELQIDAAATRDLYHALGTDASEFAGVFRRQELKASLRSAALAFLEDRIDFGAEDLFFDQNVDFMVSELQRAALKNDQVIPLGTVAPQRLARYLLFSYGVKKPSETASSFFATPADLLLDPEVFRAGFGKLPGAPSGDAAPGALEDDSLIGHIAATGSNLIAAVPLLQHELPDKKPGDVNSNRIDYYYGSDLSHLYQAERLLVGVFDDIVNDDIMFDIVTGMAEGGLFEKALNILETQIYQSEMKAKAYLTYANQLTLFGRFEEASQALAEAHRLFQRVIDGKGDKNASDSDFANLQNLAVSYRNAGALKSAEDILFEMAQMVPSPVILKSITTLLNATRKIVDSFILLGNSDSAEYLLDFMASQSQKVPATASSYQLRIFYLLDTAKRYVEIGAESKAFALYQNIEQLRQNDGLSNLTGIRTWTYADDMVGLLSKLGRTEMARSLAESIPTPLYTADRLKAFQLIATHAALTNGLGEARYFIDTYLTTPAEKFEALTYFAANRSVPYVAATLIDNRLQYEANQALDMAMEQLDSLDLIMLLPGVKADTSTQRDLDPGRIVMGYAKAARLYLEASNPAAAFQALDTGVYILKDIPGLSPYLKSAAALAQGYSDGGDTAKGRQLLDAAKQKILDGLSEIEPAAGADLFNELAEAYLDINALTGALLANDQQLLSGREIFVSGLSYSGSDHDLLAKKKVETLLRTAKQYIRAGSHSDALAVLDEARETADQIYVEMTRSQQLINGDYSFTRYDFTHLIGGYALAGDFDYALSLARGISTRDERNMALGWLADTYSHRDDFPETAVASVDTDGDGKPDFFAPSATAQEIQLSGLVLDEDCDGDGIPDTEDRRPLFADR